MPYLATIRRRKRIASRLDTFSFAALMLGLAIGAPTIGILAAIYGLLTANPFLPMPDILQHAIGLLALSSIVCIALAFIAYPIAAILRTMR